MPPPHAESTQAAAARLHLRRPPRPLPLPQPGPAFESRREPGELRRWTGATPHLRLLLPPPPSLLPVLAGGVCGARPALRRLSRSRPGPPFPPRGAYIGAPRPHPPARASSGRPGTASFRCSSPRRRRGFLSAGEGVCSSRGCGGNSVARGRVLPAIAQIAGGPRWARSVAESQAAVDPAALPDLADCMR